MKSSPLRISAIAGRFFMLVTVMIFSASAIFAQAQVSTADLNGTVVDPNGAAVAGATVTVKSPATGISRTVTASDSGEYSFIGRRVITKSRWKQPTLRKRSFRPSS
jgi:Mn2+/Fe2+ NRAMP family transporter